MNERFSCYTSGLHSSPCGTPVRKKYVKDCTTNPPSLREIGVTDQQSLIDSFRDECDVNKIVARYIAGDCAVLQRVQGIYTDITGVPNDPVEAMNLGNIARTVWDNLTPEQQQVFGSPEAFSDAILYGKSSTESPEATEATEATESIE